MNCISGINDLISARPALLSPTVKLLLVGVDPAVPRDLNIGFRRFTGMHHGVLRVDIRQRQLHDGEQFRRRQVFTSPMPYWRRIHGIGTEEPMVRAVRQFSINIFFCSPGRRERHL